MNSTFEIASQRSTSKAYWVTLALISNIANYLKYNDYYFWDSDGIDNVTLRLWKFSDFCSTHTVGVAGDAIMFHILVCVCVWQKGVFMQSFKYPTPMLIYCFKLCEDNLDHKTQPYIYGFRHCLMSLSYTRGQYFLSSPETAIAWLNLKIVMGLAQFY